MVHERRRRKITIRWLTQDLQSRLTIKILRDWNSIKHFLPQIQINWTTGAELLTASLQTTVKTERKLFHVMELVKNAVENRPCECRAVIIKKNNHSFGHKATR